MSKASKFKNKMSKLNDSQIIDLMSITWNDAEGAIFRDFGFEILEERNGEEYADRIYSELWNKHEAA